MAQASIARIRSARTGAAEAESVKSGRPRQLPLPAELLAHVRRLHFEARRLADQVSAGRYRSAFRGTGIEFEEVREYVPGDETRSIDWKVTARSGRPYIKSFREERELTVVIAVDVSGSSRTATRGETREAVMARIGAFLTLVALRNNDKVGLVTFSDRLESYHPPRKARSSAWRILHEVLRPSAAHRGTDIGALCRFLNSVLKRRAIVFLLSDFLSPPFERELAVLAQRHDVTALLLGDPADGELPRTGLVRVVDPETLVSLDIDCSYEPARRAYAERAARRRSELRRSLMRHGVDALELSTDRPFTEPLRRYFERRSAVRARVGAQRHRGKRR